MPLASLGWQAGNFCELDVARGRTFPPWKQRWARIINDMRTMEVGKTLHTLESIKWLYVHCMYMKGSQFLRQAF